MWIIGRWRWIVVFNFWVENKKLLLLEIEIIFVLGCKRVVEIV